MNKTNNFNYTIPNETQLKQINNGAKKHITTIKNIIKLKLIDEFNNANIDYSYLKLCVDLNIFENADYYFTGLFKFNKEVYEVVEKENNIVILNKNNKKEFTELYKRLCNEITIIGETIFVDRINKLESVMTQPR
jgi:hypothetical protein